MPKKCKKNVKLKNSIPIFVAINFLEILPFLELSTETNLSTIPMDFEKIAMNAVRNEYPYTRIRGYFFHFTQCLWLFTKFKGSI